MTKPHRDDTDDSHQLLTYSDAGRIAGVSKTTIGKWVKIGVLRSVPMPGSKRRRIKRAVMMRFLHSLDEQC
ncbi:excisionase family DNA-binding protein [Novipirellula aureliae]|nr:helix-turn-helix domain-containing protein [Novipirellula aureliae]